MLHPSSYLYVPADQPSKVQKAGGLDVDAVILDLEDSVPRSGKDRALGHVLAFLESNPVGREHWVRVEPSRAVEDARLLLRHPALRGLVVPKADRGLLAELDRAMSHAEGADGRRGDPFELIPLVETAQAVIDCAAMASMRRVTRFGIGEADLAASIGVTVSPDRHELWPVRLQVVLASSAAGIAAPIGPVHLEIRDLAGLEASTRVLADQGFGARTALHPAQIPVIDRAFAPSEEQVRRAESVVALFERSESVGSAVATDGEGSFIDAAVVRQARNVLARDAGRRADRADD